MKIIRVFPRRTKATPDDELACVGPPDLFAEADEVHVSVSFTWDKPRAEQLAKEWERIAPALTHMHFRRVVPYFSSRHVSKRLDEKPLESTAKLVSTAASGAALLAISAFRIGVKAGFSKKALTF